MEYHHFSVAQQGAEIFEFKVDPVPKLTILNVMSWSLVKHFLRLWKAVAPLKTMIGVG